MDRSVAGRGHHAPGLLPAGAGPRPCPGTVARPQLPGGASTASATSISEPVARSGWSNGGSRSRCPTRSCVYPRIGPADPALVSAPAAGERDTAWASGTTARRSRRNTTACATTARATVRGWIHWRTSARRGELMVKEFEQQNEQDLAILIDPWLPRTKVAAGAARGDGAGDLVRGHGLPGDLPPPGPAADPGLDRRRRPGSARARHRSSCCTSCSSNSP